MRPRLIRMLDARDLSPVVLSARPCERCRHGEQTINALAHRRLGKLERAILLKAPRHGGTCVVPASATRAESEAHRRAARNLAANGLIVTSQEPAIGRYFSTRSVQHVRLTLSARPLSNTRGRISRREGGFAGRRYSTRSDDGSGFTVYGSRACLCDGFERSARFSNGSARSRAAWRAIDWATCQIDCSTF